MFVVEESTGGYWNKIFMRIFRSNDLFEHFSHASSTELLKDPPPSYISLTAKLFLTIKTDDITRDTSDVDLHG